MAHTKSAADDIARLASLMSEHPTWGRTLLAREMGCTERAVRTLWQRMGHKRDADAGAKEGITFEQNGQTGYASSLSRNIRTLDDLLNYAQVDRELWEVERYVINKWDMGYKDADKEAQTLPLYQIKAWLKKRAVVEHTRALVTNLLSAFKEQAPPLPTIKYPKAHSGVLMEVSIFDLHLGKLCWAPESGANYDSKIAQSDFRDALATLLDRVKGFDAERILYVVGNDFFNVDGKENMTTAGTSQREDGRWQKSFVNGRKLQLEAILRLREIAPVDVVMVPGNHDLERVFYLGEALSGWLSKTPGVSVNNEPPTRKYYGWGKNLLGFTHGNEEKHTNLPLIMATEQPALWAAARFREFHCGHWHHKKEIHFQPVQEFNGIRVRLIPSLCPADDWHRLKGYDGLRAAEIYVWDKNDGCVGNFSYTPPEQNN